MNAWLSARPFLPHRFSYHFLQTNPAPNFSNWINIYKSIIDQYFQTVFSTPFLLPVFTNQPCTQFFQFPPFDKFFLIKIRSIFSDHFSAPFVLPLFTTQPCTHFTPFFQSAQHANIIDSVRSHWDTHCAKCKKNACF